MHIGLQNRKNGRFSVAVVVVQGWIRSNMVLCVSFVSFRLGIRPDIGRNRQFFGPLTLREEKTCLRYVITDSCINFICALGGDRQQQQQQQRQQHEDNEYYSVVPHLITWRLWAFSFRTINRCKNRAFLTLNVSRAINFPHSVNDPFPPTTTTPTTATVKRKIIFLLREKEAALSTFCQRRRRRVGSFYWFFFFFPFL